MTFLTYIALLKNNYNIKALVLFLQQKKVLAKKLTTGFITISAIFTSMLKNRRMVDREMQGNLIQEKKNE